MLNEVVCQSPNLERPAARFSSAWALRAVALLGAGLLATSLIGCGDATDDDDGPASSTDIEIAGVYQSNYDATETISNDTWHQEGGGFESTQVVVSFDNEKNLAVTQNPADDAFNPSKFNRIVWTEPDASGAFYYCTVDFGLESADEAAASTTTADDSDPENSGCGGFSWTHLTPKSA